MRALLATDPEWALDIVGVPSDLTVADVEKLAQGIEAQIRVHASLPNEDIAALIAQSSLFVSASEYEGFGIVAIEAMSAGLLPVLQDNGAYTALAAKHPLIKLGDFVRAEQGAQAILKAWQALLSDPVGIRSTAMREADVYSWSNVAGRYIRLYQAMLAGKSYWLT
jgi:alpha-1,3-mannosyltransferase